MYVVLQRLDVEKETIELVHTKPTETQELPYRIPTDSPRYHFFIFKHSHQGQLQEALGQYSHPSVESTLHELRRKSDLGIVCLKIKVQSLSTHHHADGKLREVCILLNILCPPSCIIRCLSTASFFSSVHIFNAWVHLQYQRTDAVFQL